MTTHITVTVSGTPLPEGSLKAYCRGGRAVIMHDRSQALETWRTRVTITARNAAHQAHWQLPVDQPVKIAACFLLPRPKTVNRLLPSTKPDLDKLARAIGDALCPRNRHLRVLTEDSRIVEWAIKKRYAGTPEYIGAYITITRLDPR